MIVKRSNYMSKKLTILSRQISHFLAGHFSVPEERLVQRHTGIRYRGRLPELAARLGGW